jgi:hypothetical protein
MGILVGAACREVATLTCAAGRLVGFYVTRFIASRKLLVYLVRIVERR